MKLNDSRLKIIPLFILRIRELILESTTIHGLTVRWRGSKREEDQLELLSGEMDDVSEEECSRVINFSLILLIRHFVVFSSLFQSSVMLFLDVWVHIRVFKYSCLTCLCQPHYSHFFRTIQGWLLKISAESDINSTKKELIIAHHRSNPSIHKESAEQYHKESHPFAWIFFVLIPLEINVSFKDTV